MIQFILPVLAVVLGTIAVSVLSIFFIPRAILLQSNQALRAAAADLKGAAEAAAKAEAGAVRAAASVKRHLEEVTARYDETREVLADQSRRHRNEVSWLRREFFRATGQWPSPMPDGYRAETSVP